MPGACTGAIQDRRSCRKAVESFLEMLSAASDMFFPKGSVPLPISLHHGSVIRWQAWRELCRRDCAPPELGVALGCAVAWQHTVGQESGGWCQAQPPAQVSLRKVCALIFGPRTCT